MLDNDLSFLDDLALDEVDDLGDELEDDESELSAIDDELAAIEMEYGGDDAEVGALPRRRVRGIRGKVAKKKQQSAKQRAQYSRAVTAAKKNAAIAKKYVAMARNDKAIGRLLGFRGPSGTSFGTITGTGTTTTLTGRPQKDVVGGTFVVKERRSSGAAFSSAVVKEIKIGVYPLFSSADGVAVEAFNQDSTMNTFRFPAAEVGNEISIQLEVSAAPVGTEAVVFTAAMAPFTTPAKK